MILGHRIRFNKNSVTEMKNRLENYLEAYNVR